VVLDRTGTGHEHDGARDPSGARRATVVQPPPHHTVDHRAWSTSASSAGSTLPPETTATVLPAAISGRLRQAAAATAPLGSATRRAALASAAMAARIESTLTGTTAPTRRSMICQGSSPTAGGRGPSAIVRLVST